ncbi:MAG: DUF2442 domain-containing protein [Limisphaerales bacterium]
MKHNFARVIGFKQADDHILDVTFDDGTSRRIDFLPVLIGDLFEPLREKGFFAKVRVDVEAGTLIWPNGADFDPDMLHDWESWKAAFEAQVAALAGVR